MSLVKMRERGQLTIPYEYRKELGLESRESRRCARPDPQAAYWR